MYSYINMLKNRLVTYLKFNTTCIFNHYFMKKTVKCPYTYMGEITVYPLAMTHSYSKHRMPKKKMFSYVCNIFFITRKQMNGFEYSQKNKCGVVLLYDLCSM